MELKKNTKKKQFLDTTPLIKEQSLLAEPKPDPNLDTANDSASKLLAPEGTFGVWRQKAENSLKEREE